MCPLPIFCGKNKNVAHRLQLDVASLSVTYYWTDAWENWVYFFCTVTMKRENYKLASQHSIFEFSAFVFQVVEKRFIYIVLTFLEAFTYSTGLSPRFQVARLIHQEGGESNSQGFLLVLFFFYFPVKVARSHVHSSRGKFPAPAS